MLALRSPQEAYRKVDFDARVAASRPADLVHLCIEHLVGALGTALYAGEAGDNELKSKSLTRALTAVTALQLGVSGEDGMAAALRQVYEAARRTILDCAIGFDADRIAALRTDFLEIGTALRST